MSKKKELIKELIKPTAKVELITPEDAVNWLRNNTENRPVSERKVQHYYNEMEENKYEVSTDGIGWDTNNKLVNGQHRLQALVRYGKPLYFVVVRGLAPKAFNVIDTGKNRTNADILHTHGFGKPQLLASIVRFIITYERGKIYESVHNDAKTVGVTNQAVLDFTKTHNKALEDAVSVAGNVVSQFKGISARFIGGMYWEFRKLNRDASLEFMNLYATGEGLTKDSPIYQLRNKIIGNLASKKKYPERDKLAWMILAWNHWRKGNTLTKLQWAGDPDSAFPRPI